MIKKFIKKNFSSFVLILIYKLILSWRIIKLKQRLIYCTLCETKVQTFYSGLFPWIYLTCSKCFSLSRHRIIADYLKKNENLDKKTLGHFAAEECLESFIKKKYDITSYNCFDYNPRGKSFIPVKNTTFLDIENVTDEHFDRYDFIFCNHVLEHVDFLKAIKCLKKMIKNNGSIFLTFPIIDSWNKNYINQEIKSEYSRTLHFQQFDHLQLFGREIEKILETDGFKLKKVTPFGQIAVDQGIHQGETLYILKKI